MRVGQQVEATVEAFPGQVFKGKVAFIDPAFDPTTRTVNVRYDFAQFRGETAAWYVRHSDVEDSAGRYARLPDPAYGGTRLQDPVLRSGMTVVEQRVCPVTKARLGSMGDPISVDLEGRKVWVCCADCPPKIKQAPAQYLASLTGSSRPRRMRFSACPSRR